LQAVKFQTAQAQVQNYKHPNEQCQGSPRHDSKVKGLRSAGPLLYT